MIVHSIRIVSISLLISSAALTASNAHDLPAFQSHDFRPELEGRHHFDRYDLPDMSTRGKVPYNTQRHESPGSFEDFAPLPPSDEEQTFRHSPSRLESAPLSSVCAEAKQPKIQLSLCSTYYISCEREAAFIRKCPFPGTVFVEGKCLEARKVPACLDSEINMSNEDTRDLAESEKFCISRGSGVFRTRGDCQDQAILCEFQTDKTLIIGCPVGMTLTDTLGCIQTSKCHVGKFRSLRDLFIYQVCSKHRDFAKNDIEIDDMSAERLFDEQPVVGFGSSHKCRTWFISCSPAGFGEIVRCEPGFIADGHTCRQIKDSDKCYSAGVCAGHEYDNIALGECLPEFIYCDGNREVSKRCDYRMVFYDGECRRREEAGCDQCVKGDKVAGDKCNEYRECDGKKWQNKACKEKEGFDKYTKQCVEDYYCAQPVADCEYGSAYVVSCERYFVCEGGQFIEKTCPYGTSYDVYKEQCTPNKGCYGYSANYEGSGRVKRSLPDEMRGNECRHGDMTPSRDCQTFFFCDKGQFRRAKCEDANGHWSSACFDCSPRNSQQEVTQDNSLMHPAECQDGQYAVHPDKCDAYFECQNENWQMKKCPAGQFFSTTIVDCEESPEGECGNSITQKCQEGERVVHEQRCDRLLECMDGEWVELECPKGFRYDAELFRCEPGDCTGTAVMMPPHPQAPVNPPPPPPAIFQEAADNIPAATEFIAKSCTGKFKLPDHHDCTRLWECNQRGFLISKPCPASHFYDTKEKECVLGTCAAEEENNADKPQPICENGHAIPTETCGEYRFCQDGNWVDGVCDENLAFVDNHCGPDKCKKDHIDAKFVTTAQCVHQSLQTGSDETSYRFCYYGQWLERKCPSEHVFNWKHLKCVQKQKEFKPYKPSCNHGTRRPYSNTTDVYEECEHESWVRKYCAFGQSFVNSYCTVMDDYSKEESREDYERQHDKPPQYDYCMESGGPDGYRRVPHDCTKYYQCVHGSWLERPCAPGTVWSEKHTVCDHIGSVPGCGRPGQTYYA